MGRFDRSSRRPQRGGFDRKRTEMYPAVCDACGKECKVPFKPSNDKPIYCSNCFEKQGGGNDRRESGRRNFSRSQDKEMFSAVCDDCGKDCQVPFNPSSDKPIYCSKCFEKRGNSREGESSNRNSFGNSEQLDLIISKLDQIITALECKCEPCECKSEIKKVVKKKTVKKTTKKAKEE